MEREMEWRCLGIYVAIVVILAGDVGNSFKISFHKKCLQPVLTPCPPDIPLSVQQRDGRRAAVIPKLVITRLQDNLVGKLSWRVRGPFKDSLDQFLLRLSLSVNDSTVDVQCLNVTTPPVKNPVDHYCVEMVPDNSAQLTMDVILSHDQSCDCDNTNKGSRVSRDCRGRCSLADPVVSSVTASIGKLCCQEQRRNQMEDVKMRLSAWEITPDVLMFELHSEINNPYSEAEIFIHPDDDPRQTLLHLNRTPSKQGLIYFNMKSPQTVERFFYAKLCVHCTEEMKSYQCYITDVVQREPIPNLTVTNHTKLASVELDERKSPGLQHTHVLLGVLAGTLLVVCMGTVVVWVKLAYTKRKRLRLRQISSESNNLSREKVPLHQNSTTNSVGMKSLSTSYQVYIPINSSEQSSMILFHPDSQRHHRAVSTLVKTLTSEGVCVEGLPDSERSENWRDFAEKAGDKYRHIIIVYSPGLHRLLAAYDDGGISSETCRDLLLQRNQEYIPCVVMTKLKVLYQHGHTSFCIHFVLFGSEGMNQLNELISKCFSFLHGNNFKIYSLPFVETDPASYNLLQSIDNNTAMRDLLQCLSNNKHL